MTVVGKHLSVETCVIVVAVQVGGPLVELVVGV